MPRLNGFDALQRIRKHHSAARVILLSGGAHALDASQITFVQKPFENEELIKRVRETLDFESQKG
jgi:DNA-binding response OmpR family regulator